LINALVSFFLRRKNHNDATTYPSHRNFKCYLQPIFFDFWQLRNHASRGGEVQAYEEILSGRFDLHVDSHCEIEEDSGDAEMAFE